MQSFFTPPLCRYIAFHEEIEDVLRTFCTCLPILFAKEHSASVITQRSFCTQAKRTYPVLETHILDLGKRGWVGEGGLVYEYYINLS